MSAAKYTDNDLRRVAGIQQSQFQSAIDTMLEGVDAILDRRLKPIEHRLDNLETDMVVVKKVLTETNHDLKEVKQDVKRLDKRMDKVEDLAAEIPEHSIRLRRLEQAAGI